MHWKGGSPPPPPLSAPSLCPATVSLTPSASLREVIAAGGLPVRTGNIPHLH